MERFFFKISLSGKWQGRILSTFYFLENFPERFFFKIFLSGKWQGRILSTFYLLENFLERFFFKISLSGKWQGRKMLRPYPTGECLGSIFVSRWTRAPGHVSFLDAHFQRSTLRQRDNLLFEMGELFRARLCDEITILDTYRAHLWDHKFRLEGDHHARLQRIF